MVPKADQGLADAQFIPGPMYAQGKGVKQDFGEAVRLYCKAAEQVHEEAKKAVSHAEEELRLHSESIV